MSTVGLFKRLLRVAFILLVLFLGFVLLGALLGVTRELMAWGMLEAASGSFASAQIPLSIWTGGATFLSLVFRVYFLYRLRATHRLRLLEYPGALLRPSVLVGGIAYGAIVVMVTFAKGLLNDAELANLSPPVTVPPGILLGIFPLLIAMMAAYFTAEAILKSLPESREPSKDERDLLRCWSYCTGIWQFTVSFVIGSCTNVMALLSRVLRSLKCRVWA